MSQEAIKKETNPIVKKTVKSKLWARTGVQIFFFVLVALTVIGTALKEAGIAIPLLPEGSLHSICPFGGVVSIYKFATVGTFVQKIHESSFILMIIVVILTITFGAVFCGWMCPFGTFQEWLGKLGRKVSGKRYNNSIPASIDKYLRYIRYIVLVLVVYATAVSAKLVFQEYDPYHALFNFWSSEVSAAGLVILGVIIVMSLFVERPWCKYACPYGALLGLFNGLRIFKIRRNAPTCIDCKACDRSCPMNITVSTSTDVKDHQCISCLKCTSENACPIAETVEFSTKGGRKA